MDLRRTKRENDDIVEPMDNNISIAEIVDNEEDKKILEQPEPVKNGPKPAYLIGYIVPERSFLRSEANIYSDILAFLSKNKGLVINLDNSTEDFYYVTVDCKNGYVIKSDVEFNG